MVHPKILEALRKRGSVSSLFKCPRVDFGKLKSITKRPIKDFHIYSGIGNLKRVNTVQGPYFYRDNGAKILIVAHLDTVLSSHWAGVLNFKDDTHIYSTALDDRLGVYVALELLQKAGLEYDILLTTNEESGNSTSQWFEPPEGKKYNWIVSFDRRGTDVVTYSYTDMDWHRALRSAGFSIGTGTYSCISDLDHLGVCGVNIGIGYYANHTKGSYASLNEIRQQVSKFLKFYSEYYDVEFKYTPKLNTVSRGGLRFAYDIPGRFTEAELQIAVDFYEQLQEGATFAELGFPNQIRITKNDIESMVKSGRTTSRLRLIKKKDESEQLSISFPKNRDAAIKTEKIAIEGGHDACIIEKCVECGKVFEVSAPNTEPYCPTCREVIANRHARDVEPTKTDSDEKPTVEPVVESTAEPIEINKKAMLSSIRAWLKDPNVTAQSIGTALRIIRENLPEDKVRGIYDELIKSGELKQFRISKLRKSNYPITPGKRLTLTLRAMSALINHVGIDLSKTSMVNNKKWISKLEIGHRNLWAYMSDMEPFEDYLLLLSDYADPEWLVIIDLISKVDIKSIIKKMHDEHGMPRVGDPEVKEEKPTEKFKEATTEKVEKPIIKLKFRLDTSNNGYDFHSTKVKEGIEFGWKEVKTTHLDTVLNSHWAGVLNVKDKKLIRPKLV